MLDDRDRDERQTAVKTRASTIGRARRLAGRRFPLVGEMALLGLVIGVWELVRMPLEGPLPLSLAHARDWLAVEHVLRLDLEASLIRLAHRADAVDLLHWGYLNLHLPVLFGFMALACLLAPERYPMLRSAFVLAHVPALIVIGLYPLAPPRWVAGMPFAVPAPDGLNGPMHNATAAAASLHVGYPLFIAASTVWLASPRPRLAWLAFAYPALVFVIVVGTANHYTLDAIVGGLCIAVGFAAARLLNGPARAHWTARSKRSREPAPPLAVALLAATGYACVVRAIETASDLSPPPAPVTGSDLLLVVGAGAIFAAWWWSRSQQRDRVHGLELAGDAGAPPGEATSLEGSGA